MPSRNTTPGATIFPKEAIANARLIAAAPDLLDVAKATLEYWDCTGFSECEEGCECIVDAMRAAIAKAEGR